MPVIRFSPSIVVICPGGRDRDSRGTGAACDRRCGIARPAASAESARKPSAARQILRRRERRRGADVRARRGAHAVADRGVHQLVGRVGIGRRAAAQRALERDRGRQAVGRGSMRDRCGARRLRHRACASRATIAPTTITRPAAIEQADAGRGRDRLACERQRSTRARAPPRGWWRWSRLRAPTGRECGPASPRMSRWIADVSVGCAMAPRGSRRAATVEDSINIPRATSRPRSKRSTPKASRGCLDMLMDMSSRSASYVVDARTSYCARIMTQLNFTFMPVDWIPHGEFAGIERARRGP